MFIQEVLMEEERDDSYVDGELSEEEEPRTQRFSVVVLWSHESDERIDPGEVQSVLSEAIIELDGDAIVEVIEINEPTY